MKVCWDNLNKLRFSKKTGKWYKSRYKDGKEVGVSTYLYNEEGCKVCGNPFFYNVGNKGECCSLSCNTKYKNSIYGITEETAKKIGKANKGKKRSEEVIEKMKDRPQNQRWKGKNNPVYDPVYKEKRRKKVIENGTYKGENNPNWKGGYIDNGYGYPLEFIDIRDSIKERDSCTCQNPLCKGKSERIEVHHIDEDKHNNDPSNLICLCRSCHALATFKQKDHYQAFYEGIMRIKLQMIEDLQNKEGVV